MLAIIGFLTAVSFWPGMAGAGGDARWATLYVMLPIALCFAGEIKWLPLFGLAAAFLAWASLSLLWTTVPFDGIEAMLHLGVIACAFCLASRCEDLRPFYSWLGLGLWVSSGIAIAQGLGYQPVVTGYSLVYPAGLFVNPNFMAEAGAAVLVALIADRSWWIAAGVLPAVALSGCRASWVALAVCGMVWVARVVGRRTAFVAALVGAAVFAVLASYTWGQRAGLWWDALHGLTFFGSGIGSFYSAFPEFSHLAGADYIQSAHAHNDLLELVFELGVVGLSLAVAAVWALYSAAQAREQLVVVALGVTSMFGFPLHTPTTALLFGIVAGHAARGWDTVRLWELLRRSPLHGGRRRVAAGASGAGGKALSVSA
jgi:O-antigen ligase